MVTAFAWGAVGAATLLFGALIAYRFSLSRIVIAVVMAVGTGTLIGSVSFELIDEALKTGSVVGVAILVLVGAAAFTGGDWLIGRYGGAGRKDTTGAQARGSPLAIVFGSVLDGIPESFVLGLTVVQGGVSPALLAGVMLSNLPEGMASSNGLKASGWPLRRVALMWTVVLMMSAVSAAAGYLLLDPTGGNASALAQAFAAGALLAMLANTLLPEAYAVEGVFTGSLVVAGFAVSLLLSAI